MEEETEILPRSTHRVLIHISLSKEDDDGDLAYPVYIHVEMEYLKWFEGNYAAILDECTSCICKNFGEIEGHYFEHSPNPVGRAQSTANYGISPMKRIGNEKMVFTFAVMRRRIDDYSIVMPSSSSSSGAPAVYRDREIGPFSIYSWIKPKPSTSRGASAGAEKSHLAASFCEYPPEFALS
jgi:hypothetical protein